MPRALALAAGLAVTLTAWTVAFRPGPPASAGAGSVAPATGTAVLRRSVVHSEAEWRRLLSPLQYDVLRRGGTERAFTGAFRDSHAKGVYRCAACGAPLFGSDAKFDSGTGWPSFWRPVDPAAVETRDDTSLFERRIEALCPRCGSHLGHVLADGPPPTGLRYCINSAALAFEAAAPDRAAVRD